MTGTVVNNHYNGTVTYNGTITTAETTEGLTRGPVMRALIDLPEGINDIRQHVAPKPKAKGSRSYFRFENAADAAEVYIYDEITDPLLSEFGMGISASSFAKELADLKGKPLTVHVNSPGGSVFEGIAIYNLLRQHDAPVNVIVDGIAASIASVIAMAGDTVTMAPHSMLMIHDAWGITMGNAADHEQQAKVLNTLSDNIAGVYRDRGDSRRNWRAMMLAETWITDEEAVNLKLADRVDTSASPATNNFDLSRYRNVPEDLVSTEGETDRTPTKRSAEQALRDAGFSAREAKVILASGWTDEEARDEPAATDPDEMLEIAQGEESPETEITGTVTTALDRVRAHESRAHAMEMMELMLAS